MLAARASNRRHGAWIVAFVLAYALLASLVDNDYYLRIMAIVLIWAVMGLSWNLISGYSGFVSFGHAAFFGLGGYFVVLAQIAWQWTPWLGIPVAGLIGAAAGLAIGVPTFRLRGHYFALAMLAYPLALLYVFEWLGYQEVTLPRVIDRAALYMQFHDDRMLVYVLIALGLTVAVMLLTRWVEDHRFGMALLAIKQDETAAEAAGIDTRAAKLKAITLSGAIAGAIGGFYAVVQLVVTPASAFGVLVSAQALTVAMFGGVGTVWGPIIGAVALVPLSAWLDAELAEVLPGIQGVLYGAAIIVVVLLAPEGVFWRIRDLLFGASGAGRVSGARAAPAAGASPPAQQPDETLFAVAAPRHDVPARQHSAPAGQTDLPAEQQNLPARQRDAPAGHATVPVLAVHGLTKAFGGLHAVDDVSFRVERGEIVGLIGPNGAGKTTLFNLLNGITTPDRGRVLLNGIDLVGRAPNRVCRAGIGRTFQVVKPFRRMSILENVVIGAYAHTRHDREARALARHALAIVGLEGEADRAAGSIGNDKLRLVELARALAGKPSLLLLDEIFAGLSAQEVESLTHLVRRLVALGITIVIIEHTMHAMVKLVDRFVVLDHGRVLADGSPQAVTKNPDVIAAYLGRKWMEHA